MSDLDRENLREETKPLTKQIINESESGQVSQKKSKKKLCVGLIIFVVIVGIILAIVLPLTLKSDDNGGGEDPFSYQEYNPYQVDTQTFQTTVWKAEFSIQQKPDTQVHPPSAFMKLQGSLNGASYKPVDPSNIIDAANNNWATRAKFNIDLVDNYQARVFIRNEDTDEDQLKKQKVNEEMFPRPVLAWEARLSQLAFQVRNESFHFSFGNIYSGETIISTKNRKMLVSDYYSEVGFVLPTQRCFGLGQRNGKFQLQAGTYTLHARGREEALPEDDQLGGNNGNHIHPFVLCQTGVLKDFFGMFFVSNAPQVFEIVQFAGQEKQVLNYITLGGPLEIYFIMRGKAQEIIQKYHAMIGYSQMPPYYALGMFQGSNSYNSWTQVENIFTGYKGINQAIEGVFIEDFNSQPHWSYTVNSENFKDLSTGVQKVHDNNQHLIWGTSYALHNSQDFVYFNTSTKYKCLIDSAAFMNPNEQVTGILDGTTVQYIDSYHTGMLDFMQEVLPQFNTTVSVFDGLLIKDSHLPNSISGEVKTTTTVQGQETAEKLSTKRILTLNEGEVGSYEPYLINKTEEDYPSTYYLPFIPNFKSSFYLDNMTISLNATHSGSDIIPNLYVHNGVAQRALQKTYQALVNKTDGTTRRPLLFTEASWSGSGAYGVALVTDIYRSWSNLKNIINQALGLSMYGMSNTMIDACGSLGPMDEELCARWMQLAAFMPMARNYYNKTYKDPKTGQRVTTPGSEPYNFKNFSFQAAYGAAVANKLQYSRYIYSQMYQVYREGGALLRPLFFDYPEDDQVYAVVDQTYMLGDSIKVSPVLEKGLGEGDQYKVYFPQGLWIDLNNVTQVIDTTKGGQYVSLQASFAKTNVHLKGGKIIPFQLNSQSYRTTRDLETKHRMGFKVARDAAGKYADGYILVDDGVSYRSYMDEQYTFWKVRYAENSINFWVQYGNFDYQPKDLVIHYLDQIEILNAADLNDTNFACYLGRNLQPVNLQYDYNEDTKTLTLKPNTATPDVTFKDIGFIKFGNNKREPDFCNLDTAFTYSGTKDTKSSTDTYWKYDIQSKQGVDLLEPLVVEYTLIDNTGTINVEITTKSDFDGGKKKLYRVPTPIVYNLTAFQDQKVTRKLSEFLVVQSDPTFTYSIYLDATDASTLMWTSDPSHLYFTDYFIMDSGIFKTNPDNGNPLLGMGERAGSIFYKNEQGGIHSRYTFDQANPIDDGLPPGRNFYGYQPFYAFQATTRDWFGVFDINSYATDYVLYSDIGNGQTQIHKIAIGGTINKFFFSGNKIDDMIRKYQKLVGNPSVPPLWAFGWQQCRFGYVTSKDWYDVYLNYNNTYDLPLDVMWADIDYLDDYKLFTIAPQSYSDLPEKVSTVKSDGRYFVPIMDAGVAVRENQGYKALDDGLKKNVFIKQANKKDPLTAGVWCGNAYFPDFFKPDTIDWWKSSFDYLYNDESKGGLGLKFDGVWLDENEATNFCNGYCKTEERPADSLRNKPFYVPGWRDLEDKALGVDGWHDSIERHEYDVHNLYAIMQSKATAEFLINKLSDKKNARPYVLTRSNYPGIGKYAHHWMGDNWSTVEYMSLSVDGVYSYNLFGLPFMGSDICGFNGDAAPDLCTKWHQLGSLYPFSRNHNQNASASQEPYRFNTTIPGSEKTTYTDVIRTALINRYSMIKYYYSAFHSIGNYGGSFFKPLFYEFQDDVNAYDETILRNNILLGEGLKASIQTQTLDFDTHPTTDFYFPAARWCQVIPSVDKSKCWDTSDGKTSALQNLPSGLEDYYVHIRGGYIVPWQDAPTLKVRKTRDLVANPTDLMILPNAANSLMVLPTKNYTAAAAGYVYFDDGITTDNINRFDMYLSNNGDKTFDLYVSQIIGGTKRGDKHETLGVVTFLWASKNSMDTLTKAQISDGKNKVDLQAPVYDSQTDTLKLSVVSADGKTTWTFWDIKQITLQ